MERSSEFSAASPEPLGLGGYVETESGLIMAEMVRVHNSPFSVRPVSAEAEHTDVRVTQSRPWRCRHQGCGGDSWGKLRVGR